VSWWRRRQEEEGSGGFLCLFEFRCGHYLLLNFTVCELELHLGEQSND